MGHYDEQYEETARRAAEAKLEEAKATAKSLAVPLMAPSTFEVIGVCTACAKAVYHIPNWGCKSGVCPHRPL